MQVLHSVDENKGVFYIEVDGKRKAAMTYSIATKQLIIIDHTEVDDSLRGTGAGKKMVEAAVNMARENGIKIIPLCPFVKATMEKFPEMQDVRN